MNEAMSVELCSVSDGISVTKELTVETLWTLTEVVRLGIKVVSKILRMRTNKTRLGNAPDKEDDKIKKFLAVNITKNHVLPLMMLTCARDNCPTDQFEENRRRKSTHIWLSSNSKHVRFHSSKRRTVISYCS